jgi:phenylacetate-CoA ligase
MFVRPEQIAEIGKRHPELGRLRLVVARAGETDVMTLRCESASSSETLRGEIAATLRAVTKLQGNVDLVASGDLPNDGKIIADERGTSSR